MFQGKLIDSGEKKNYDTLWHWVLGISLVGGLLIIDHNYDTYLYDILITIWWGSLFGYGFFRNRHKKLGTLTINKNGIIVQKNEVYEQFSYDDIKELEINRGARVHYEYEVANDEKTIGNYVEFNDRGLKRKFEFLINTKDKNKEFEDMIKELYRLNIPVLYKSV